MRSNKPSISFLALLFLVASACGSESSGNSSGLPEVSDPSFGEVNQEQLRRMVEIDPADDGPFYMVNLVKFRERALYPDGRESNLTGREADELYAPFEFLRAIGAEIVFATDVESNLISMEGTHWDQIGIVRYPSRALFFQMTREPEFRERAIHKDAGVEKSLVIVTQLRDPSQQPPMPDDVPHPASPDDAAVAVVHLLAFREVADYGADSTEPERSGKEAMSLYEQAATPVALEQGVGPIYWFDIEGVFIGDGRDFDEFRINIFPSHTAFDTVVANPDRLLGQRHRVAALADTYTTTNAILVNRIDGAGAGLLPRQLPRLP